MTALAPAPPAPALPWVTGLAAHGERTALHTPGGPVSYRDLADRVEAMAARLAGPRRLVQVSGGSTLGTVVALLGAQAAGHVVLLGAPGAGARSLRQAYDPDVVLDGGGGVRVVRAEPRHDLHPDLALLLSTSGSTGSAKLVRLSAGNLAANTAQIQAALGIRTDDVAALTLPLTYCYGLSVLQTHLAVGAGVLLTDRSVVDDCFWAAARSAGVTTFPGVPHTYELLERSGFGDRDLPSLRYLTQAGGRMDPARVARFAELGATRGWDLVVMYGQCEATARMTYLPADLAAEHPDTVGVPVAGASVDLEDGEIVFRGPNVMLGYAHGPADLALGRTVEVLHTGDLGELTPEGLLRVVGRRARFVKVLGHRVDLDALECRLRGDGCEVRCAGRDGLVAVAASGVASAPDRERLRRRAARDCGLPRDAIRVLGVDDPPVLPNGKPDYPGILALAERPAPPAGSAAASPGVAALYAELLGGDVRAESTFVGLGGDSLSYVEVSLRLEQLLGHLPPGWHVRTVEELDALRTPAPEGRPSRWQTMETSIWLRALAIVLIVGTHADLFTLQGSANALLVVAGYQLARFQLADPDRRRRARRVLGAVARIALPTVAVVAAAHLLLGLYETRNLVLANWVFGQAQLGPPWRFWFVEALVLALLLVAALARSRTVATLEARHPFGLPLALTAAAFLLLRVPVLPLPVPRMHGSALVVLHLVLLGWALARAGTRGQRWLMTGVVLLVVMTFSWNPARDGLTAAFVLALLWWPVTRVPVALVPVVRVLAAASLYVYVIHWQALEVLWVREQPVVALAGSLALGVGYWWLWTRPLTAAWRSLAGSR